MADKRYLFTPGPTPVPPQVLEAMSRPIIHHRSSDFREILQRTFDRLGEVYRTEGDVLVYTSSGTGGMESAISNLTRPGDRVVVVSAGHFGERWAAMAENFGCDVDTIEYEWGETPSADDLSARLAETGGAKVVFLTHSETSTGVVADVQGLAAARRRPARSSSSMPSRAWEPSRSRRTPGARRRRLGIAEGADDAARARHRLGLERRLGRGRERRARPVLLRLARDAGAPGAVRPGVHAAVSIVVGLDVALGLLLEEGLEQAFERHTRLGRACRAGVRAMGLELFSPDDDRSAVVTAINAPDGIDSSELVQTLRDRQGIVLAPGQGPLKGKVFRIGHIGYYDVFDITTALAGVELVLAELGADIERGAASPRRSRPSSTPSVTERLRVLIREPIAEAGIELLREQFEVDVNGDLPLEERIGDYDAIVIRSATKLTADVLERADRLKVIGRAGVGVDNVDVDAATRRGIVVANAPESTVVSAAEHAVGLLVALARHIPQAHASLKQGRWERSSYGGIELEGKTLGVLGFGRIGQQVARRAVGLGMDVVAHDPFVAKDRFRELGVTRAETVDDVLAAADFLTLHLPLSDETRGSIDADALAKMRPGARLINAARGELVDEDALLEALRSGHLAGAALDVFSAEPYSGPLLELDSVVVTPHLAASTEEAQDRAGMIVAEQVAAALAGGLVANAVNIPAIGRDDLEVLGPFVPLAAKLGRLAMELAEGARSGSS